MQSTRRGTVALIAATALWAQLALIPTVTASAQGTGVDILGGLAALFALGIAGASLIVARERPDTAIAMMLAGFPLGLGLFAVVAGRHALVRFDAPARMIAAATAVGFVAATIAWAQSVTPRFPVTVAPTEPASARGEPPPLHRIAFIVVAVLAMFVAIVAPVLATGHAAATRAERLGGENLARARDAVTSAGGLVIALMLVLGAGTALLRGRAQRRRPTRGVAFMLWGIAVAGLLYLLEHSR